MVSRYLVCFCRKSATEGSKLALQIANWLVRSLVWRTFTYCIFFLSKSVSFLSLSAHVNRVGATNRASSHESSEMRLSILNKRGTTCHGDISLFTCIFARMLIAFGLSTIRCSITFSVTVATHAGSLMSKERSISPFCSHKFSMKLVFKIFQRGIYHVSSIFEIKWYFLRILCK